MMAAKPVKMAIVPSDAVWCRKTCPARRVDGKLESRTWIGAAFSRSHQQANVAIDARHPWRESDSHPVGTVVRGIGFSGHRIDTGAVVVGADTRRCRQLDRLIAPAGSGQAVHRVGADLRIPRRYRRVRGAETTQCGSGRLAIALVAHGCTQREGLPCTRPAVVDRRRPDHQVRACSPFRRTPDQARRGRSPVHLATVP